MRTPLEKAILEVKGFAFPLQEKDIIDILEGLRSDEKEQMREIYYKVESGKFKSTGFEEYYTKKYGKLKEK